MSVCLSLVTMVALARIKSTDLHASVWTAGLALVTARNGTNCVPMDSATTMDSASI